MNRRNAWRRQCSGTGISIKQVAETVAANVPGGPVPIVWDTDKPKGDAKRLMDMTRAKGYGFECQVSLEEGIKETIDWFINNKDQLDNRYIAFNDPAMLKQAG